MTCPKYVLFCNYLPQALHGRADRPRIFHECTNSAVIRLLDLLIHGRFSTQFPSQLGVVGSHNRPLFCYHNPK